MNDEKNELNIVLVNPEIPQNTGNIVRTCAATGARLHIILPMGFAIDDKKLKRAGLDYWHYLDLTYYDSLDDFFEKNKDGRFFYLTSKGAMAHSEVEYKDGDFLLLGKETKGLPESLLIKNPERCIRIPMISSARCLNLSNAAAVVVYEALRQTEYATLTKESDYLYGVID